MAYYDNKNNPAENPLGLDKEKLDNTDLDNENIDNEEQTDNGRELSTHDKIEQNSVDNEDSDNGEKRGFWTKIYDRFSRNREISNLSEDTKETYEEVKETAKDLEAEGKKLKHVRIVVDALKYEVALRDKNKSEVAGIKDAAPISAEDIKDLRRVVEAQKSRAKYNDGRKYLDVEPIAKQYNEMEKIQAHLDELSLVDKDELLEEELHGLQKQEQEFAEKLDSLSHDVKQKKEVLLGGIAKMNKKEFPPEDLALVNKIERRLNLEVRNEVFHGVAEKIGRDTKNTYTPEEMKLFLIPPDGLTMNKNDAMKALEIINQLKEQKDPSDPQNLVLSKAEAMVRKLGSINKVKSVGVETKKVGPPLVEKVLKRQRIKQQRAADPTKKPELPKYDDNPEAVLNEEIVNDNEEPDQEPLVEEQEQLSEKQILFKKIAELMNEDVSNYYPESELRVFSSPDNVQNMDMVNAEYGILALDKLRATMKETNVADIANIELINEAEDYIREQAGMKNRVK